MIFGIMFPVKICFETFGCRLNRAEALQQEAEFVSAGWELTKEHADADMIVVRGCSVTARAQRECEHLIDHLRRKYPRKRLIVEGCLERRLGAGGMRAADVLPPGVRRALRDGSQDEPLPARTARAYLKVQDGCTGKCAFCIVPRFRGAAKSVPFGDVLHRAERFIKAGYHEIVVTGCNLSLYSSEGHTLADLATALAKIDSECRIRLGSIEPTAEAVKVVEAMAASPNICRFLHLAIQSGSNTVLSRMRRAYLMHSVERTLRLAEDAIPHAGLGCDIITGFPGETDAEFTATKKLLQRFAFSNLHVFPFSERPQTTAVLLKDQVPPPLRAKRAKELSEIIKHKRSAFAKHFVGREVEIVVEDEKHLGGWTSEYLWCSVRSRGHSSAHGQDASSRRPAGDMRQDASEAGERPAHDHEQTSRNEHRHSQRIHAKRKQKLRLLVESNQHGLLIGRPI